MNKIHIGVVGLVLAAAVAMPSVSHAQSSNIEALLEQLQSLMAQVEELQGQLRELRGEVREALKEGLREGMTDEDIKAIQEILATDPSIYPEGLTTGYFGPLTRQALMRFQEKFGLVVTGEISSTTHAYLEELLQERFGDNVPPGLLRAPGIIKKVEERLCDNSGKGNHRDRGFGPLCKTLKDNDKDEANDDDDANDDANDDDANDDANDDDANDDANDDDANDDDEDFDVEVEIEIEDSATTTTVSFTFEGDEYEVEVEGTDEEDILDAVADELDVDVADLDEDLEEEILEEVEEELEELEENDDES